MPRIAACFIGLLVLTAPTWAEQPQGKIVDETWSLVQLDGARVGNSHMLVRETERDGKKSFITTVELNLNLRRDGNAMQLGMETGTEERADGKVSKVWMRQSHNRQTTLSLEGIVKDDKLDISVKGQNQNQRTIPWDDRAIGLYRQEKIFRERKVKPGDKFSVVSFEPTVSGLLTTRVTVRDYEEVQLYKGKKQRLLRVEELPDKVEGSQGMVQLPGMTSWLDKDLKPVCSEFEMPLLGMMKTTVVESKEIATSGSLEPGPELLKTIRLNRPIQRPNDTHYAVYRITIKGDTDPGSAFASDERQESKVLKGSTIELHVRATSGPKAATNPGQVNEQYLKSCFFINSDDPAVKRLARNAVGAETDPWTKAQLIERWVHENMRVSFTRDFCPAGDVARDLSGDCRQHGMLATAMCRAAGVPARTAIGLVYALERRGLPVMAFHMWTEVSIDGQWLSLDATRGEGHVGATHLKVTDSSWYNETSLRPLLPFLRVVGKLKIELLRVEYAE